MGVLSESAPDSYYRASAGTTLAYPALEEQIEADVCVVGAGLCGISCALELTNRGYRVAVLEANTVAWGASGRSGGQVIVGYSCGQAVLERLVGFEDAKKLWDMSVEGVRLLKERVRAHDIDCDLVPGHLHAAVKPAHVREIHHERELLEDKYGYSSLQLWDREQTRDRIDTERYLGGLFDSESGHLHPLNFALGLARAAEARGVRFFEHSKVLAIDDKGWVRTARSTVRCRYVVLCCNAFVGGLWQSLSRRITTIGSYIGATRAMVPERAGQLIRNNMAVADCNNILDYYRLSGDYRVLFGGRVGHSTQTTPDIKGKIRSRMLQVFPQLADLDMEYVWGGLLDLSMNRAPDFGRVRRDVYYAQGFSGQGVAATGLAGRVIAEAIAGTAERFDVFTRIPHRRFPSNPWMLRALMTLTMFWYDLKDRM